MKFFASIATAFLLLSAVRADIITPCTKPDDLFQIRSVSATKAVAGKGLTVTLKGEVKGEITEAAQINFDASVGIIQVSQTFKVCEVLVSSPKCPIKIGRSKTIKLQFTIPANAPNLQGVAVNGVATQGGSRVFCVTGTVDVTAAQK
ncbi:hypothetical protein EC968_008516 [Mortierella alpina]|nr:hypothetical protein EC968_008516 [Mortierella alpina]